MAGDPTIEGLGVLERAVDMARRGEEFVLATVVWREGPTSGQSGARAILTAGGDVHGWIGGACAEPVFIREATKALTDGTPRLIALGDPDRFGDLPPGTVPVEMRCQSEGALQIYQVFFEENFESKILQDSSRKYGHVGQHGLYYYKWCET